MKDISLEELLDRIYCSSIEEINPILNAVRERFGELWSDWELTTLSVHGHTTEDHAAALAQALALVTRPYSHDHRLSRWLD